MHLPWPLRRAGLEAEKPGWGGGERGQKNDYSKDILTSAAK